MDGPPIVWWRHRPPSAAPGHSTPGPWETLMGSPCPPPLGLLRTAPDERGEPPDVGQNFLDGCLGTGQCWAILRDPSAAPEHAPWTPLETGLGGPCRESLGLLHKPARDLQLGGDERQNPSGGAGWAGRPKGTVLRRPDLDTPHRGRMKYGRGALLGYPWGYPRPRHIRLAADPVRRKIGGPSAQGPTGPKWPGSVGRPVTTNGARIRETARMWVVTHLGLLQNPAQQTARVRFSGIMSGGSPPRPAGAPRDRAPSAAHWPSSLDAIGKPFKCKIHTTWGYPRHPDRNQGDSIFPGRH